MVGGQGSAETRRKGTLFVQSCWATLPWRVVVVSLAKNAPSIAMGDRLAVARFILMGKRLSREYPQAKNSVRDHKSDCAPVSVIAETVAWVSGVGLVPFLRVEAPLSNEMVMGTFGCSRRRARLHSPLEKI